jgi:hypothetical protein
MADSHEHCHDDYSEHEDDHGWIEIERIYKEKSTEEESLIDWFTKNVDLYLSFAVASGVTVSI